MKVMKKMTLMSMKGAIMMMETISLNHEDE